MRFSFVSAVVLVGAACGSSTAKAPRNTDAPADAPAVVAAPVSVPVDTMKAAHPVPVKPSMIPADPLQRQMIVGTGYALVTATMVNGDIRMLRTLYDPAAKFTHPDSTLVGVDSIVKGLMQFARNKSMRDFQRISHGSRVIDDSTLADSGIYRMIFKRLPKDSVIEDGRYRARWRARPNANNWVILEDVIMPGKGGAPRGKQPRAK